MTAAACTHTFEIASGAKTEEAFNEAYLSQAPIVFPLLVTIDKPVILDMPQLLAIAKEVGVADGECDKFVSEFEDSVLDYREQVFAWARKRGYSGAIIVNDMTPVAAGGDWGFAHPMLLSSLVIRCDSRSEALA